MRGRAIGIATVANWVFNFVFAAAFEPVLAATSPAFVFGVSGGFCVIALFFIRGYVPETRGIEPEAIAETVADLCRVQAWLHRCCGRRAWTVAEVRLARQGRKMTIEDSATLVPKSDGNSTSPTPVVERP